MNERPPTVLYVLAALIVVWCLFVAVSNIAPCFAAAHLGVTDEWAASRGVHCENAR